MIHTFLSGWTLMRWIRLAIGVFIGIQSIRMHDGVGGMFAAFFLFQALTNTGCCGTSCASQASAGEMKESPSEVQFEEVQIPSNKNQH